MPNALQLRHNKLVLKNNKLAIACAAAPCGSCDVTPRSIMVTLAGIEICTLCHWPQGAYRFLSGTQNGTYLLNRAGACSWSSALPTLRWAQYDSADCTVNPYEYDEYPYVSCIILNVGGQRKFWVVTTLGSYNGFSGMRDFSACSDLDQTFTIQNSQTTCNDYRDYGRGGTATVTVNW